MLEGLLAKITKLWNEPMEDVLFCPDCGLFQLYHIESTEPDEDGEYKEVRSCKDCENIVYIVRSKSNG